MTYMMMLQSVFLFAVILSTVEAVNDEVITSCEQVLTGEECKKLAEVAKDLLIATPDVLSGLKDALKQKGNGEIDVYTKTKEYLDAIFMCRIFMTPQMCSSIQRLAADKNVPFFETETSMNANMAKGIIGKKALYAAVLKYIHTYHRSDEGVRKDGNVKSCVEVIGEKYCKKLEDTVTADGLSKATIIRGLKDASMQGAKGKEDIYHHVLKYLEATFLCELFLVPKMCKELQHLAADKGVAFHDVQTAIQANLAKGVKQHKDLYTQVMLFIVGANVRDENSVRQFHGEGEDADVKLCEDILSTELCQQIQRVAAKHKLPLQEAIKYLKANAGNGVTGRHMDVDQDVLSYIYSSDYRNDMDAKLHHDGLVDEKESCRSVLADNLCKDLEELASQVDLPSMEIVNGLKDGSLQKATGDNEIYERVREYLDAMMLCEVVLTQKLCRRIQHAAYAHKIPLHDVDKALEKYVGEGITEHKILYERLMQFILTDVDDDDILSYRDNEVHDEVVKACIDFLPAESCDKITEADVVNGFKDASIQGIKDENGINAKVKEYLESVIRCAQILNQEQCDRIKESAMKWKVPLHEVDNLLTKYSSSGHTKDNIYQRAMMYISTADDELSTSKFTAEEIIDETTIKTCQDILPSEDCKMLEGEAVADKLEKWYVLNGLKDAVIQGAIASKDICIKVEEYFKSIMECEKTLDQEMCEKLRSLSSKSKVPFREVEKVIQSLVARGIHGKDELYNKVVTYVNTADDEVTDTNENYEDEQIKTCIVVLSEDLCRKLNTEAANDQLKGSDISKGIRDAVIQGMKTKAQIYQKVKEYLASVAECADILNHEYCGAIKHAAETWRVPFFEIDHLLRIYSNGGVVNKHQLYQRIMNYINTADDEPTVKDVDATELNCKDHIQEKLCENLDIAAKNYSIPTQEISKLLTWYVAGGLRDEKELYNTLMRYITTSPGVPQYTPLRRRSINEANDFKEPCTNVLSEKLCEDLKRFTKLVFLDDYQISLALKDASLQGATEQNDIFNKSKSFLEARSYCEFVLPVNMCKDIQIKAENKEVPLRKVCDFIQENIEQGIKEQDDLYSMTMKYIESSSNTKGYSDVAHNKCMDRLNSVMQCLSLKIFAWRQHLNTNAVNMALEEASLLGETTKRGIYKKATAFLKSKAYCVKAMTEELCDKLLMYVAHHKSPLQLVNKLINSNYGHRNANELYDRVMKYLSSKQGQRYLVIGEK